VIIPVPVKACPDAWREIDRVETDRLDYQPTAATNLAAATTKREAEKKMACSIDAMMNGGECKACQ